MQNFIYKAREENGNRFNGTLEAEDIADARFKLRNAGYYPISVTPEDRLHIKEFFNNIVPVGLDDLVLLCQQFSSLINAGMPIMQSLDILWKQTTNRRLQLILSKVKNDLAKGSSLFDAMNKYPDAFPSLFLNLVKVGEAGGALEEMLKKVVIHFTKEYELRQKIKSALVYPTIVVILAVAVVGFMVTFVVPVFSKVFTSMAAGASLPLPTTILLKLSIVTRAIWWTLPILLIVLLFVYRKMKRTRRGAYLIDNIKLKLPLFGDIFHKVSIARAINSFAILVSAGVPIKQVLEITGEISDNLLIENAFVEARDVVMEGGSLHKPLADSKLFPLMVTQMIAIGEESGNLESMLAGASYQLDQQIDYKVKKLTVALEPILTVGLGFVVGFIAISLYLPIFDLVKVMRG